MLLVQKHLKDKQNLKYLEEDLRIKFLFHENLPLVILNYNHIDSPKFDPIVCECRGLVLNTNDWSLVARSFPRFFNWGEHLDGMKKFDFSNFTVESKEDGSLIIIYFFNNEWRVNTRGSFANELIQFQSFTWEQAICKSLQLSCLQDLDKSLDRNLTYVCEFVSPWNKIVRSYKNPKLFLLAVFRDTEELNDIKDFSKIFNLVDRYYFSSIEEIKTFLKNKSNEDPTFEGVVICDKQKNRWKIKSPSYLGLHKIRGEGDKLFNPKHLLPFALRKEKDELLTYFPEVADQYYKITSLVSENYDKLLCIWKKYKDIESQKEFALKIKNENFSSLLFDIRKKYGPKQEEQHLLKAFTDAEVLIFKTIKNQLF